MRKKILSTLLTICMLLTLLPVSALAADYESWEAAAAEGVILTADTDTITIDGVSYTYKGDVSSTWLDLHNSTPTEKTAYTAGSGYILWQPADGDAPATVTLHGATIHAVSAVALYLPGTSSSPVAVTLEVEGENTLTASSNGIYHNYGDTVIEGDGTLDVTSTGTSAILQNNDLLTISGDVTVSAGTTATTVAVYGIDAQRGLTISDNASVTASGGSEAIYSNDDIIINTTGTVDAPQIRTTDYFTYTSGTMTGSRVEEGKGNYYENDVYTVYGSYEMTDDQTIVYCSTGEDGLTVADGATLTIQEGKTLTVQDGTEITNNGTIVNNGIINFMDESITAETITNLNLSGSGKIQIGSNNVLLIDGEFNTVYSDISNDKLDLNTDTPTEKRFYTAGDGYVVWEPTLDDSSVVTSGTFTLHNATINNTSGDALVLPNLPVTIEVEGENNITSSSTGIQHNGGDADIQGSGILNVTANGSSGILQRNNPLTITGDVTVNASATGSGSYGISAMNALTISGNADVTASGVSNGIYSNSTITVNTTGTVDAQKIYTTNDFSYQSGTLIGSWVLEGKDNYYMNLVQTVYGNFELNVDKTIRVMDDKDGLTVADGATLTIDEGVTLTVEDGTEITNNGTIVNNGTINFQDAMISAAAITALNLTGNGSVQVNGITVLVADGKIYTPEIDISNSTLDLSTAPDTDIAFIAGNGYVLWEPTVDGDSIVTSGTLTLLNATMEANEYNALITLPTVDVTVELEGENSLTNNVDADDIIAIIEQGGVVVIDNENPEKQAPQDYTLTFSGAGTLETETNSKIPISTDGTLSIASSGNIDTGNVYAVNFVMESGYLEGNLYSSGNIVIKGGTIYAGPSVCVGDFSMTGGTATFDSIESYGLRCLGTVTITRGMLTASILNVDSSTYTITYLIYGDVILSNESMPAGTTQYSTKYVARIMNGSSLTIDSDAVLYTAGDISGFTMSGVTSDNLGEYIVNDGTLVNNGIILLPNGLTDAEVKTIAQSVLKASGTGTIQVYDGVDGTNNTVYTNDGTLLNVISGDITLTGSNTDSATMENDGYTWTGDSTDGYTLTLGDVYLDGNLTLPDNCSVEIHTTADSVIHGAIQGAGSYFIDFTFTGTAPLTINGDISGFTNGDTVTVQDGAQVTLNGFISIGDSGTDGTLVVTGSGTTLSIPSTGAYAVGCDAVQVTDGAALHTSAETYSISAGTGGVSVTGGSTLTVGCDYGVYIEDGTFTVDDSSTFTADAAVAAVCVVDTSKIKSQSETLNVSSTLLPSGTEIASATGDTIGRTYWSIVTSGNTLSATNESSKPATISNALGSLILKEASTHYSSGGGSGSVSYVLTFQTNGGSEISNVSKTSGTTVGLSGYVSTRAGYDFAGWYSDTALTDAVTSVTLTQNTTVYAKWVEKSANPFTDVSDSSYYHDAVLWAVENNVTNGTSDTAFSPAMICTRAQMVTFLWRAAGSPEPVSTSCPFTDVSQGAYYYKAVLWAVEQGITTGTSSTTFGSDDIVTRGQAVTLIWRGAGEPETTSANPFSDVSTDAYYYDAVLWAVENGITQGTSTVSFSPANSCTRAQIATFLYRYMGE